MSVVLPDQQWAAIWLSCIVLYRYLFIINILHFRGDEWIIFLQQLQV